MRSVDRRGWIVRTLGDFERLEACLDGRMRGESRPPEPSESAGVETPMAI